MLRVANGPGRRLVPPTGQRRPTGRELALHPRCESRQKATRNRSAGSGAPRSIRAIPRHRPPTTQAPQNAPRRPRKAAATRVNVGICALLGNPCHRLPTGRSQARRTGLEPATIGSTGTYGVPTTPSCCFEMAVSEPPRGCGARKFGYSLGPVTPHSARIWRAITCRNPLGRGFRRRPRSGDGPRLADSSISEWHHHDRVRRRRTHARADAAPGAHIGSNRGPARDDIDGAAYRAPFRAHGTERAGMSEAGHRLDPGDAHLPRLIRVEHAGLARRDTRRVLTHDARGGVQVDHRCASCFAEAGRCVHDGADWTRRDALIASRAAGEERDFVNGAWWTMDRQGEPPADSGLTDRLPVGGCLSWNRGNRHRRVDPLKALGRRLDDPTEQSSPQEITPG